MTPGRGGRPGLIGMAARTAVVAGTATAVSGNVQRRQQGKANEEAMAQQDQAAQQAQMQQAAMEQEQQAVAASAQGGTDVVAELQKLSTLHEQGVLNDAEFTSAKAKLLS
jgi:microsomal dipeptidase-like Zn-dependent dipeptidase